MRGSCSEDSVGIVWRALLVEMHLECSLGFCGCQHGCLLEPIRHCELWTSLLTATLRRAPESSLWLPAITAAAGGSCEGTWEFPKIRVPYLGVLIIRILLFRVLY